MFMIISPQVSGFRFQVSGVSGFRKPDTDIEIFYPGFIRFGSRASGEFMK